MNFTTRDLALLLPNESGDAVRWVHGFRGWARATVNYKIRAIGLRMRLGLGIRLELALRLGSGLELGLWIRFGLGKRGTMIRVRDRETPELIIV